jgi:broad specificity phosphatase PhoE
VALEAVGSNPIIRPKIIIMAVEIYIARHGQNEDNVNGILNGHRDDIGRQQARNLAAEIKDSGLQIDKIYTSPLSRAVETAEIVARELRLNSPKVVPELIERNLGEMHGVPIAEIEARHGANIIKTDTVTYFLEATGAETFDELKARGGKALDKIRSLQKNGTALLVCHGDIGKMMYAAATEKSWKDALAHFHFGNGELIAINADDEVHKIKLPQFNE